MAELSNMSGLLLEDKQCWLRSSSLFVHVNGFVASTSARLRYFNQVNHEVEAAFVYDDNEAFITDFRAMFGQRKIHTEIREAMKEKDAELFSARSQSNAVISMGKIPPKASILLDLDVVGELQTAENGRALVYRTPEIFTPLHNSEASGTRQSYKLDLKIASDMPWQLAGCHSPTHAIQVDADANATSAETVTITLAEVFRYDRQILVYFYPAKPLDAHASIEPGLGPAQETYRFSKNRRNSDSSKSQVKRRESLGKDNFMSNSKARNVSASDAMAQDFPKNNTNEKLSRNSRSSQGVISDTNYTKHFLGHDSRIKKHFSALEDSVNLKNEVDITSAMPKNLKRLKDIPCATAVDSTNFQTDTTFQDLENSADVGFSPKEDNLSSTKELQKNHVTQTSPRENPSQKGTSSGDSQHRLKERFSDNSNNFESVSIGKYRKDLLINENLQSNKKEIGKSLTCNDASSGKIEDLATLTSKTFDTKMSFDKTRNRVAQCSDLQSKPTHFLGNDIIAASFLPDISKHPVFGEYVFMLDRSGSMNGSHICNAKESLVLFLKSLPTSSYFNVVSFGSYSRSLFPGSQRYSEASLEKACVYVNSIKADMGGSELLSPLKAVLEKPQKRGYVRNVFVLTDGDIAQPDAILKYLKKQRHKARIFTFGIGPKISYRTVRSIASSTQGKAYFTEPGRKVQTKVIQCLKEVLKPTLCEIKVDWQLPTQWQLLRATPDIAFATCDQRVNLYASIQLPFTAQSRLGDKRKSSSVKEFWFDEELDSCQLGDNMFFEDFSGCWSTDTDTSTSECEQRDDDNVGARRKHVGDTRKDVENNRHDVANARNVIGMDWEDIENDRKNIVDNQDIIGNNRNDAGNDNNNIAKARNDIVDVTENVDNEAHKLQEHVDYFDKTTERFETRVTNVNDIAEKWREMRNMRIYSSDTSTETEDECQIDYDNNRMTLDSTKSPDKKKTITYPPVVSSQRNYDLNCNYLLKKSGKTSGGLGISGNFIHDQAMDTCSDITTNNISKTTVPNLPSDSTNNSRCIGHDSICKDGIPNDVILKYVTRDVIDNAAWKSADGDRKANSITQSKVDSVWNTALAGADKKSKENVIDWDDLESSQSSNHVMDDGLKVATPLNMNNTASIWGSVLITGHVGADIHREIIPLRLSANTTHGISLHQMASKKLIDSMEALIDNSLPADSARMKREIVTLSKESRVPSSMTSITTVDDSGNTVGVWQDTVGFTLRRQKQSTRNSPKFTTGEDAPPAILISSPSVDEESRSPTKRRHRKTQEAEAISDDGKYYRIERLDPEGCDEIKYETRRTSIVACRNIPIKTLRRQKIVSTRLTLLTRKMRNAHKLNVFAGPPFIRLILLQSAEGFWQLTYAFARIIGLPLVQLELAAPFVDSTMIPLAEQDDRLGIDCYYDSLALWATSLALVYLKRKWIDHEEEWELIAIKAQAWLQKQTFPPGFACIDVTLAAKQALVLLEQKYRCRAKSEPVGLME